MSQETASDPVAEVRLIQSEVRGAADMVALRIDEFEKRSDDLFQSVEKSREAVESRAHLFGVTLAWGVVIGLVILFVALFYSMTPILEGVVNRVANSFDWEEKVEAAANAELQKRLTAEALTQAIDAKAIEAAAANVVDSKEFRAILETQVESAVKASVTMTVDEMIAQSQAFQTIISEQLQAEQARLQEAIKKFTPLTAENREELQQKLLAAISDYDKLGQQWTRIDIYPFDDVLHIRATLYWRPESPEDERLVMWSFSFEGMTATTDEYRRAVEQYLGQPVPASVGVRPADEQTGKKFIAGQTNSHPSMKFSTYDAASNKLVDSVVNLVDDCFGIEYPVRWRVTVSQ